MKKKISSQNIQNTFFVIDGKNSIISSASEIIRKLIDKKNKFKSEKINNLIDLICYIIENIENIHDNEFVVVKESFQEFFDLLGEPQENRYQIESAAFIIFSKLELFKPRNTKQKTIVSEKSPQVQILVYDLDKISPETKEYLNDFIMEADEFIEKIEEDLLKLEAGEDIEILNRLFRAMHTLKGGAGTIEFEAIQVIAHRAENIMDKVRDNKLFFSPNIVDTIFKSLDILKYCLKQLKTSDVVTVDVGDIVYKLDAIIKDGASEIPISQKKSGAQQSDVQKSTNVKPSSDRSQSDMSNKSEIVENALTLSLEEKKSDTQSAELTATAASAAASLATPSVNEEKKVLRVEAEKLDVLMNMAGELVISKIMIENGFHNLKLFHSEFGEINAQFTETLSEINEEFMKVSDLEKITGIISRHNKSFISFEEFLSKIELANTTLGRLTTGIQQGILKTRLVPLSSVFNRYNRLVRDLSKSLNKDINFIIEGAETEVDKIIVEVIGDPIVHIIRNSLDHGIETPEIRQDKGKPSQGTLKLKAYYEGEQVIIEISDDGKGINAEFIKKKAIEKKLITPEQAAEMSKQEAQKLIFKAGFSTAETVTNLSGRGVGMDVVQDVLTKLKGRIEVNSDVDTGTTVKLRLPLTMAIINVLSIKVGGDIIAIPLSSIKETISLKYENIRYVSGKEVFNLRGDIVPIVRLGNVLNSPDYNDSRENFFVVIVGLGADEIGLIVDELVQQQQVVIKNLGTLFKKVKFISGATIMGDGSVCLILDIEQILTSDNINEASAKTLKVGKEKKKEDAKKEKTEKKDDRKKILIVDDSKPIRTALKLYVEEAGFFPAEAASGEEAFELVKKNQYNIISIDAMMPGMNGYELTAKIRTLNNYLHTPIIMVSALSDKLDKIKGFDAGVDDYVVKPVDKNMFISMIMRLMK